MYRILNVRTTDYMWDDGNNLGPLEIHNYLNRVMYQRRNKFDPLWNSLVLGGVKNGKKYLGVVCSCSLALHLTEYIFIRIIWTSLASFYIQCHGTHHVDGLTTASFYLYPLLLSASFTSGFQRWRVTNIYIVLDGDEFASS